MRFLGILLLALSACSAASGETASSDGTDQGVTASTNANQTFALDGSQTFNWRCTRKLTIYDACYFSFTVSPTSMRDVNGWLQKHKDLLSSCDPAPATDATLSIAITFADVSFDGQAVDGGMKFGLESNAGPVDPACTSSPLCEDEQNKWEHDGMVSLGTDHTITMKYNPTLHVVRTHVTCAGNGNSCVNGLEDVATIDLGSQPDFPTSLSVTTALDWGYGAKHPGGGA
jgi:hypothetical protein